MWKATHIDNYPAKINMLKDVVNPVNTRASASGNLLVNGNSTITQETFINDATKAWNKAPASIKESKSQSSAKKHIKDFVKTLPI